MGKTHSLIGFLGWLLLALPVTAHPSHNSYTEIDWNQAGDSLEVSMRIIPEELETALSWRSKTGKAVILENEAQSAPLVEAYLSETFQVRNAASELMPLTLVGMSISYAESWLYFTVAASSGQRLSLRNSVLQELESQQINRVRRLWRDAHDSQVYRQNSPEQLLWDGD